MYFTFSPDVEMLSPEQTPCCFFIPDGEIEIEGHFYIARVHAEWWLREASGPVALSAFQATLTNGQRFHLDVPRWASDNTMLDVLSQLYPHIPGARQPSSIPDWTRVSLLSSYWGLTAVKAKAERSLEQLLDLPADKAIVGKVLGLQGWESTGMQALNAQGAAIGMSVEEIQQIVDKRTEEFWKALMQ